MSLFGDAGDDLPEPRLAPVNDWMPAERLAEEFKAIGFYLSGHPLDDYMGALKRKQVKTLDEVHKLAMDQPVIAKLAGIVTGRQERKSARGQPFCLCPAQRPDRGLRGDDLLGNAGEIPRLPGERREGGDPGRGQCRGRNQLKLLARSIAPMDGVVTEAGAVGLKIFVEAAGAIPSVASVLEGSAETVRGVTKGPILFCLMDPALPGEVEVDAHAEYPVTPQIKGCDQVVAGRAGGGRSLTGPGRARLAMAWARPPGVDLAARPAAGLRGRPPLVQ